MIREEFKPENSGISPEGLLVRHAYCQGMRQTQGKRGYGFYTIPQFDGGQSDSGKNYKKNVWDNIAKVLDDYGFDPEEYVEFVFNESNSIQSPNSLLSNSSLERFKQVLAGSGVPSIWEFEENKLLTELAIQTHVFSDGTEALKRVITDDRNYASPLVKYAFAVNIGAAYLVEDLKPAACRQYLRKRHFYERYYKEKIPEDIRGAVDAARTN